MGGQAVGLERGWHGQGTHHTNTAWNLEGPFCLQGPVGCCSCSFRSHSWEHTKGNPAGIESWFFQSRPSVDNSQPLSTCSEPWREGSWLKLGRQD